jgi:phosphomannomutase
LSKLLVSVSGIRGIVGDSLTPEIAMGYGRAFGRFSGKGAIVVGRDTRHHGPMILSATVAGILQAGCDVIDIGVVTTPTVEFAVRQIRASGGVVVTASHNPIEYNALKLIGPTGVFLTESQGKRFLKFVGTKDNYIPKRYGIYSIEDGWDSSHVRAVLGLDIVNINSIKRRKFRVVADCVNGTASYIAAELFNELGCSLKLINAIPDGKFPRPPEPTPENLKALGKAVRAHKADIGFAFDPDTDRLAMVNEKGLPLGEEFTLALGMRYILRKKQGPVAVNLSSSMINDFVAKEAGVKLYRTKVGEVNITEKLITVGGIAGGEGNGGLIYPYLHYGRDAIQAATVILAYMAESKKTISALAFELPRTFMVKRKITISNRGINFSKIKKAYAGEQIDDRDGLKITFEDGWVQIRLSNTEPIARIMAEAYKQDRAVKLADSLMKLIK